MRYLVATLLLFPCLSGISPSVGQPRSDVASNYKGTLSHLEGVAVKVDHMRKFNAVEASAQIEAQVESKIRKAEGIKLYSLESGSDFYETKSEPILEIVVETTRYPPSAPFENRFSVEFTIIQNARLYGGQEVSAETYSVFGDPSYEVEGSNVLGKARRMVDLMVEKFTSDFRETRPE